MKLNKHLGFPLTSKIYDGVRDCIMIWSMILYIYIYMYVYIDEAGLEDLITFHEAEFGITDG